MTKKLEINSSTIDKGLDLAKEFITDLIKPGIQETGLLVKDRISFWRFKKQVQMLVRARELCDEYKIEKGKISVKNLYPLLEYSSLEEDDEMLDNWSKLMSNMIDSNKNVQNHVFPYILSQLSLDEFESLKTTVKYKRERKTLTKTRLDSFRNSKSVERKQLLEKLKESNERLENQITLESDKWAIRHEKSRVRRDLKLLQIQENRLIKDYKEPEVFSDQGMEEFEISNLNRLGLIRHTYKNSGRIYHHRQSSSHEDDFIELTDVEVDIDSEEFFILTELGEIFIEACEIKGMS